MARVLLVLPTTTYRAADFTAAAARLGAEVVVASEHRQALAGSMGSRALRVDLRRPEAAAAAIVEHARSHPIDAVVAVDDQGVQVAALAGEALGVAHNPPAAVALTRDKAALRRAWDGAGVPQPAFRRVTADDDAGARAEEVGFPCVVKPVSLSASRGVLRADDRAAAEVAARRARALACADRVDDTLLVERYVAGAELAVEGLVRDGRLDVLAVFDKPEPMEGPTFEETLLVTPSRLPAPVEAHLRDTVAGAVAAIGLREGPVHAEARVGPDGAVAMLEVAARTIGGLCARTLRFGLGLSLEDVVLRHALGLPVDALVRADDAAGVYMLPVPAAGRLVGVSGQEAARAVPGVVGLELTINPGRHVRPLPEGDRYLGFLFARGGSPAQVEETLRAAVAELDVVVEPDPASAVGGG